MRRRTPWLWFAPAVPLAVLTWALSRAPRPEPLGEGTSEARARVALTVRLREPGFRRAVLERFPADPWSQGDDFSAKERDLVRQLSRREQMRPGAVLEAIDEDVREHPILEGSLQPERGRVPPCMPRVFYW